MQFSNPKKRHWSLWASAISATLLALIIVGVFLYSINEYLNGEMNVMAEILAEDPTATADAVWNEMIRGTLMISSPMLIGVVLNWAGLIMRNRPLVLVAGIFYCLIAIFDLMFLLYGLIPAVLAFYAFYRMGKPAAPTLRPPRRY